MNPFKLLDEHAAHFQKQVVAIIVDSFKKRGLKSKAKMAEHRLTQLMACFKFSFRAFTQKYLRLKAHKARFISYFLYGIYYNEIPLIHLVDPKNHAWIECYLLALLAECIPQKSLQALLKTLPLQKQVKQACYCFDHPREGAWMVVRLLQSLHAENQEWGILFQYLTSKFYSTDYLQTLLSQRKMPLTKLVAKLEKHATLQVKAILACIQKKSYTLEQLTSFFRIFGLRGYYIHPQISNTVHEILRMGLEFNLHPQLASEMSVQNVKRFLVDFYQQLETFCYHPEQYLMGLDRLVYAMPTRGMHLSCQPWLPSILEGYQLMAQHFKTSLPNHPIMVFDQAPIGQFRKNEFFVKQLSRQYGAKVWHISRRKALFLAKKVGVEAWIKSFGYGGGRNCVLLLAPLLFAASKAGKKSLDEILNMPKLKLRTLFEAATLDRQQDIIIHMGEDDIMVPPSHYFSNAAFAYRHQDLYFSRQVHCIGRATHAVYAFATLKHIMENPSAAFFSRRWIPFPLSGMMKGMLTKPKFCLPLPMGNEELHVILPYYISDYFHQPIYHLAGTRFPKKLFPVSPLDAIVDYLRLYVPYSIQICMSSCLTDAKGEQQRSIFPWNDQERRSTHQFTSLGTLWKFASLADTQQEMYRRYFCNLEMAFKDPNDLFHACISSYSEEPPKKAPKTLKNFYRELQKEATQLKAMWKALVEHISLPKSKKNSISNQLLQLTHACTNLPKIL